LYPVAGLAEVDFLLIGSGRFGLDAFNLFRRNRPRKGFDVFCRKTEYPDSASNVFHGLLA
jgi:hypothetical protein